MKRLLKFVTFTFLLVTFLMPLLECFDTWDRPGISNDTELPIFLVVLFITLILVVATLVAALARARQDACTETEILYEFIRSTSTSWQDVIVPPVPSPPLRI